MTENRIPLLGKLWKLLSFILTHALPHVSVSQSDKYNSDYIGIKRILIDDEWLQLLTELAKFGQEVLTFHIRNKLNLPRLSVNTYSISKNLESTNTYQHSLYVHISTLTLLFCHCVCLAVLKSTAFYQYKKKKWYCTLLKNIFLCLGLEWNSKLVDPGMVALFKGTTESWICALDSGRHLSAGILGKSLFPSAGKHVSGPRQSRKGWVSQVPAWSSL